MTAQSLKKNIYTYIKNTLPLPHERVLAAPSCRGREEGHGRCLLSRRQHPSLPLVQCGGPGGKPVWEGPPEHPPCGRLQTRRASPNSLEHAPTPQTLRSTVHAGTASAEEGRGGPVQCWLSLMVVVPGEPRQLKLQGCRVLAWAHAASYPTEFFFLRKERKWGSLGDRGQNIGGD